MNAARSTVLTLAAALLLSPGARAWDDHDRVRRLSLEGLPELEALEPVEVTPLTLEVQGINPETTFEFLGAQPGETQHPREILALYAQEPDWGMDQELRVSWQQRFMGGYTGLSSQGYFHMYYPSVTLHLPFPVLSMGAAPKRAAQWARMAEVSFARGDAYWGWRFTAWALHYVEDLAQPFHSTQTHRRFIRWGSPIQGTTNTTSNFHLTYERWLARRVEAEEDGSGPDLGLRAALQEDGDFPVRSVSQVVKTMARRSHRGFGGLAKDCIAYFGERFLSDEKLEATEEELDRLEAGPVLDRLLEVSRRSLRLAGQGNRALIRAMLEVEVAAD